MARSLEHQDLVASSLGPSRNILFGIGVVSLYFKHLPDIDIGDILFGHREGERTVKANAIQLSIWHNI